MGDLWKRWRRWMRVRKAMKRMYMWEVCPLCNSDAPEIDDCFVCFGSREFPIPPKHKAQMGAIYLTGVAVAEDAEQGHD